MVVVAGVSGTGPEKRSALRTLLVIGTDFYLEGNGKFLTTKYNKRAEKFYATTEYLTESGFLSVGRGWGGLGSGDRM